MAYISLEMCMRLELKRFLGKGHHLLRGCLVLLIPSLFGKQSGDIFAYLKNVSVFQFVIDEQKRETSFGSKGKKSSHAQGLKIFYVTQDIVSVPFSSESILIFQHFIDPALVMKETELKEDPWRIFLFQRKSLCGSQNRCSLDTGFPPSGLNQQHQCHLEASQKFRSLNLHLGPNSPHFNKISR